MEFESLIFDIDGTLWDPRVPFAEGYNLQLQEEGLEEFFTNPEALTALFGKVAEEVADIMMPSVPAPRRYQVVNRCILQSQQYMQDHALHIGYPRVKETLEQLSKKHRLFIVSNSLRGYPQLCMEKLGIGHLIQGSLCYGDTGKTKGETLQMLMEAYHISSACYIGDTLGDQLAAEAAGVSFIHCRYGFGQVSSPARAIDTFEGLLAL